MDKSSPLFEPVLWESGGFRILDETLIPERLDYIYIDQVDQAIEAVRTMRTRAFGQVLTFLYSGALLALRYQDGDPEPLRDRLGQMTRQFCAARPTFDFGGLGGFFPQWVAAAPADASVGAWVAEQARGLAGQIVKARLARARRAASLLPNVARVLTHCNISGELVAVAQACRDMKKEISVIATETRPYLQGLRLTSWELAQAEVAVSVIPDCAVAQVMARQEVNAVIVGSDRCAQNGDVINKVGTYPLALMAKEYGVPFYALVQEPGGLARGEDLRIEERPASELLLFQGEPLVPGDAAKLAGRYPAFDVTPASLLTQLIGFKDGFAPASFREKYQKESPPPQTKKIRGSEKYLLVFGVPKKDSYAFLGRALAPEQSLLIPEMRPQLWGARVVARELLQRGMPATLISDNMMGTLFAHDEIACLYLFCSEFDAQGARGICGSLLAARLARAHGVPIEVLESEAMEKAGADPDVSSFLGRRMIPPGVLVHPVGNEVLPRSLLREKNGASI